VRQFAISFDYMDEAVVVRATGEDGTTGFVERFAAMGAPWHCGIDDLEAVAVETGMTVVDATTIGELHRELWPQRALYARLSQTRQHEPRPATPAPPSWRRVQG